jgi:energy-coupling factor transport system substrate-specific component
MTQQKRSQKLALIVVGLTLNLGLGFLVSALKLPFYLDTIGTILVTYYGGLQLGVVVGIATMLLGSLYSPTSWAYIPTAVAVAGFVRLTRPVGYLTKAFPTIILGLCLGIMCALISAPITVLAFGGMSTAGADYFTAAFQALGRTIANSVILGGLASDPVDKLVTSLISFAVIRRLPDLWRS